MTFQLLPLEESDVPNMMNLIWEAHNGEERFKVLYTNGRTPEIRAHQIKQILDEWREHPERHKYMKVIDTALPDDDPLGKLVGTSHWDFRAHERTAADLAEQEKKRANPPPPPPGVNIEASKAVRKSINDAREMLAGSRAHVYLVGLSTRPSYHRKGVGSLHLRWGLGEADRLGLPSYLSATHMGVPLYKKHGFETVAPFKLDPEMFGEDSPLK